jgi:hypothetical protein
VTELPLDVHQRVAGGEPGGGRGVAERVERHVSQGSVLERPFVSVAGNRRSVEWQTGARTLPAAVAALDRGDRHHEQDRIRDVAGSHLGSAASWFRRTEQRPGPISTERKRSDFIEPVPSSLRDR